MYRKAKTHNKGFTLLEILVALAIVAVALAAAIKVVGSSTSNSASLTNRTLAQWVALNQIELLKLDVGFPALGKKSGEEQMAGANWKWTITVKKTADPAIRQLEAKVTTASSDEVWATVLGFAGNAQSQARKERTQ